MYGCSFRASVPWAAQVQELVTWSIHVRVLGLSLDRPMLALFPRGAAHELSRLWQRERSCFPISHFGPVDPDRAALPRPLSCVPRAVECARLGGMEDARAHARTLSRLAPGRVSV